MIEYCYISFRAPVQNPTSGFRASKCEVLMSHNSSGQRIINITRDGDTINLHDPLSGRIIQTPWDQVKFAELVQKAPKVKNAG